MAENLKKKKDTESHQNLTGSYNKKRVKYEQNYWLEKCTLAVMTNCLIVINKLNLQLKTNSILFEVARDYMSELAIV